MNLMSFYPMQKKINVNVPLVMENTVIKKVIETKFLAVIVDQYLSWKPNISFVPKKNIKSSADYCKSLLLSFIQNVAALIFITSCYIPT